MGMRRRRRRRRGRTAHANEDDVVERGEAALADGAQGEEDLRQDLVRRQLPYEAHLAGRAEGARPVAAHLPKRRRRGAGRTGAGSRGVGAERGRDARRRRECVRGCAGTGRVRATGRADGATRHLAAHAESGARLDDSGCCRPPVVRYHNGLDLRQCVLLRYSSVTLQMASFER